MATLVPSPLDALQPRSMAALLLPDFVPQLPGTGRLLELLSGAHRNHRSVPKHNESNTFRSAFLESRRAGKLEGNEPGANLKAP